MRLLVPEIYSHHFALFSFSYVIFEKRETAVEEAAKAESKPNTVSLTRSCI